MPSRIDPRYLLLHDFAPWRVGVMALAAAVHVAALLAALRVTMAPSHVPPNPVLLIRLDLHGAGVARTRPTSPLPAKARPPTARPAPRLPVTPTDSDAMRIEGGTAQK